MERLIAFYRDSAKRILSVLMIAAIVGTVFGCQAPAPTQVPSNRAPSQLDGDRDTDANGRTNDFDNDGI